MARFYVGQVLYYRGKDSNIYKGNIIKLEDGKKKIYLKTMSGNKFSAHYQDVGQVLFITYEAAKLGHYPDVEVETVKWKSTYTAPGYPTPESKLPKYPKKSEVYIPDSIGIPYEHDLTLKGISSKQKVCVGFIVQLINLNTHGIESYQLGTTYIEQTPMFKPPGNTGVTAVNKMYTEADIKAHIISDQSPLGKALLGKRIGEIVHVNTPEGIIDYKIISIK